MKVYIYLSKQTKDRLKDLKNKYRLSLSTITQILVDNLKTMFAVYEDSFFTQYLNKEHREKTLIKPRIKEEETLLTYTKGEMATLSHIASNLLYLWANKEYKKIFNEYDKNKVEKYVKQIEKIFYETKDELWDYNEWLRKQIRLEVKGKGTLNKYREMYS